MLLSKEEIIKNSLKSYPVIRGVYFLISDTEQIVYIGKSENCYARIRVHKGCNKKHFSKYFIYAISENENLEEVEKNYIKHFKPFFNKKDNPHYYQFRVIHKHPSKYNKKGGRPKGISDRLKSVSEEVSKMYLNGVNNSVICSKIGIAPNSLYKCLKYQGINIKLNTNRANKIAN